MTTPNLTGDQTKARRLAAGMVSADRAVDKSSSRSRNSIARAASKTVLLLDDELSVRCTLERFLVLNGFLVRTASSVDEALYLMDRRHFDAAILDIRMPDSEGRSGLDVLDFIRLRDDLRSLPVLLLTGYILTEGDEAAIRYQRAHVCYKPTAFATLVRLLERLTAKS